VSDVDVLVPIATFLLGWVIGRHWERLNTR
jgi:hypothetical protein